MLKKKKKTETQTIIFEYSIASLKTLSLVCWDKATILRVISINKKATDTCNLKIDILTLSPDVNCQKRYWIWNPQRFTPWFKQWPCLNYYLSFSLLAPVLRDERIEISAMIFYFRKHGICKISFETLKSQSCPIYHCHYQPDGAVGKPIIICYSEIEPAIISTIWFI